MCWAEGPRIAWVLYECFVPSWGRWKTMGTGEMAVQVMAMSCHSSNMSSAYWSSQFCGLFWLLVLLVLPAFLIILPKNHTNRAAVFITKAMSHQSSLLCGVVLVWRTGLALPNYQTTCPEFKSLAELCVIALKIQQYRGVSGLHQFTAFQMFYLGRQVNFVTWKDMPW